MIVFLRDKGLGAADVRRSFAAAARAVKRAPPWTTRDSCGISLDTIESIPASPGRERP